MDIHSYIASGKLELFLLGELNEREREEVLAMAKKHPEIQKELDELAEAMFAFDQATGTPPKPKLKDKVFASLEGDFASENLKPTPAPEQAKVIPLSPWKSFAVAASITALLASGVAIFYASKYYEKDQQFTALLQAQSVMADNLNQVKFSYDNQIEKLIAGNFKRVPLKVGGLQVQRDAEVEVFWDQSAKEVFVAVSNLDALSDEFDYQLWAIGSEGPVGIGLVSPGDRFSMQQMAEVAEAGVFAITIEPKGGSKSPTLDKLVVIGNVT